MEARPFVGIVLQGAEVVKLRGGPPAGRSGGFRGPAPGAGAILRGVRGRAPGRGGPGRGSALIRENLFPQIDPYASGLLRVDFVHEIYWEQSGRPDGPPVLFLHGGPGAGAMPVQRRFFDPGAWRIVVFDQRGAGRSRPRGELERNTTAHLVEDIERLRAFLGIDRFVLFGGSWGSTLALVYAQAFPENCLALVLRGVFLGTAGEVDWFLHGLRRVFPEAWNDFVSALPEGERKDVLGSFHRRLLDPSTCPAAARAWSRYESSCSTLLSSPRTAEAFGEGGPACALARIEAHYFVNRCFLADGELMSKLGRIVHLPCTIVQGRYDMICPMATAHGLHLAWPGSELVVVPDAGHSAMDPGIRAALVRAAEKLKTAFAA